MNTADISIRPATEQDQLAITTLVHGEHLNPNDLNWRRFVVAIAPAGIVGAVQLRRHPDGSRELSSLVVRKEARHQGVAARLIDARIAKETARVFMITRVAFADYYARWGFRRIEPPEAPSAVWRNYWFGRLVGGLLSLLAGRRPSRLAILDRSPALAPIRFANRAVSPTPLR